MFDYVQMKMNSEGRGNFYSLIIRKPDYDDEITTANWDKIK